MRAKLLGSQENIVNEAPEVESLALGPADVVLAGRYQRVDGAGVGFVPADLRDFAPWWEAALRDWHTIAPEKFPDFAGWDEEDEEYEWLSHAEQEAANAIAAERERFAAQRAEHDAQMLSLEAAAAASNGRLTVLPTGTGTELQDAARDVLRDIGYKRGRHGCFREVRRPGATGGLSNHRTCRLEDWLVIGDATGVANEAKGAKASKMTALADLATINGVQGDPVCAIDIAHVFDDLDA